VVISRYAYSLMEATRMTLKVELAPDFEAGHVMGVKVTLSATPNTNQAIAIPDGSKGFAVRPDAALCRCNVDAAPADESTDVADLALGSYCFAGEWTLWLVDANAATLNLKSATASAVVYVEFF
jgi:hypothetical protein